MLYDFETGGLFLEGSLEEVAPELDLGRWLAIE